MMNDWFVALGCLVWVSACTSEPIPAQHVVPAPGAAKDAGLAKKPVSPAAVKGTGLAKVPVSPAAAKDAGLAKKPVSPATAKDTGLAKVPVAPAAAKDTGPATLLDPPAARPSHKECMEFCVTVMDQAGQVTDSCAKECTANTRAYTEKDVLSVDEDNGLVVRQHCMSECLGNKGDQASVPNCQQSCCVSSCADRSEYNGGGYASECPAMCRDFLKRSAKK